MPLTTTAEFADRFVCHGNTAKKIKDHTQDELLELAVMARESGNPLLLECFKDLPSLDELKATKTASELKDVKMNNTGKTSAAPTT